MDAVNYFLDFFWYRLFAEGTDAQFSFFISIFLVVVATLIFKLQDHVSLYSPIVHPRLLFGMHPPDDEAESQIQVQPAKLLGLCLLFSFQSFLSFQIINLKASNQSLSRIISVTLVIVGKWMLAGWAWVALG